MNNKERTTISNDLCEYILQRYGVEMYGESEVEALVKKIMQNNAG